MSDLETLLARYPGAETFRFGDSAALNAEILALVRAGNKTVTCEAVSAFEARDEPLPEAGRIDIALDWDGVPQLAIRTVTVASMPFNRMTEELVADQGEFRDLDHWRAGYRAYLSRAGTFAEDVEMLVERFELVEDLSRGQPPYERMNGGQPPCARDLSRTKKIKDDERDV